MTLTSGKSRATLDATCAEAVDVARAALDIVAPEGVGAHLGVEPDAERVVLHYFESKLPGYRGWRWAVTVMRASRSKNGHHWRDGVAPRVRTRCCLRRGCRGPSGCAPVTSASAICCRPTKKMTGSSRAGTPG